MDELQKGKAWLEEQLRKQQTRTEDVFLFMQEPGGRQYWLSRERGKRG